MIDTDLGDMIVGLVRKETRRLFTHESPPTKETSEVLLRRLRMAQEALAIEVERIEWRSSFYKERMLE